MLRDAEEQNELVVAGPLSVVHLSFLAKATSFKMYVVCYKVHYVLTFLKSL